MARRYKPYPDYKHSEGEWSGNIPTHWDGMRFKNIFSIKKRIAGRLGFNILSITQKGMKVKDITSGDGQLAMDYSKYQLVYKGDFAMNHMDLLTGYVDISKFDGVTSPDYRVFSINEGSGDPQFFLYILQHCYNAKIFFPLGQGAAHVGRWRLPADAFNGFITPVPPPPEQTKIAAFLDYETAKIDALIAKQERLIALLEEKRQAVISHAVTKGLDPTAALRPSGIDWLGDVPAHWVVSPLKFCVADKRGAVKAGPFGSHLKNSDMSGRDVKVISQKNVIADDLEIGEAMISEKKYRELCGFTIERDDVLVSTRGTIGRAIVYSSDKLGILHPCLIRLQLDLTKILPELVAIIIQESGYAIEQILINSNATTIEVIYSENLINTVICYPPCLNEQAKLLDKISEQKLTFGGLLDKAQSAITLLKERRTALISAAVTGKIDLRGWQAPSVASNTTQDKEVLA